MCNDKTSNPNEPERSGLEKNPGRVLPIQKKAVQIAAIPARRFPQTRQLLPLLSPMQRQGRTPKAALAAGEESLLLSQNSTELTQK